jgi:hypothetical protein
MVDVLHCVLAEKVVDPENAHEKRSSGLH